MGGVIDSVFGGGGNKNAQQSSAYTKDLYADAAKGLNPYITGGGNSFKMMGDVLGANGAGAQTAGFQNFMDSTGYKFLLDSGSKAITGNASAKGLLRSGATAKALESFGQNLASTKTMEYMNALLGMSQVGAGAAANKGNIGQAAAGNFLEAQKLQTESKANAWGSLFDLGSSIAMAASDARLKEGIQKIGELANGLGVYVWHYITGGPLQWGVLAHEVAEKQPEALGPTVGGFLTVNYGLIRG